MYIPVCKSESLLLGKGEVAVVTGWTPRETISKRLDPEDYAVIGNLYSAQRGINFLLRNLIANPQINSVIAFTTTKLDVNANSVDYLEDFFANGWFTTAALNSSQKTFINSRLSLNKSIELDSNIPTKYLKQLKESVTFARFDDFRLGINFIKKHRFTKPDSKPKRNLQNQGITFPFTQISSTKIPGLICGNSIHSSCLIDAWIRSVRLVANTGYTRSTRHGGQIKELLNNIVVIDAQAALQKKWTPCDYTLLPFSEQQHQLYLDSALVKQKSESSSSKCNVDYTYGDRLYHWFGVDQIQVILNRLNKDSNNSAIVNLWDVNHDNFSQQPPCLNHLNFRIVANKLALTATFRSHDIYSAWLLNTSSLLSLQQKIATLLDNNPLLGRLTIISQSAHIYEDCWGYCEQLKQKDYSHLLSPNYYQDPLGYYVVNLDFEQRNILVVWQQKDTFIKQYQGNNLIKLYKAIVKDAPALEPEHLMYLGTELQKAQIALEQNKIYIQDKNFSSFKTRSS